MGMSMEKMRGMSAIGSSAVYVHEPVPYYVSRIPASLLCSFCTIRLRAISRQYYVNSRIRVTGARARTARTHAYGNALPQFVFIQLYRIYLLCWVFCCSLTRHRTSAAAECVVHISYCSACSELTIAFSPITAQGSRISI